MEVLEEIEEKLKASIDIEKLKSYALNNAKTMMEQNDNEVTAAISKSLGNDLIEYEFLGVTIHLLNSTLCSPYLRIKIELRNERTWVPLGQYDIEYGISGEVQDDYFYLV